MEDGAWDAGALISLPYWLRSLVSLQASEPCKGSVLPPHEQVCFPHNEIWKWGGRGGRGLGRGQSQMMWNEAGVL